MCSKLCAKLILIVSNFIIFVAGGVLLGFGITGVVAPQDLQKFLSSIDLQKFSDVIDIPSLIVNSSRFMLIVGAILVVFSCLGCLGALCEVKWMLFIYWISLVLLILLEIALIIFAVVRPGQMEEETIKLMKKKWSKYSAEKFYDNGTIQFPPDALSLSIIAMQFKLGCCGIEYYKDYDNLTWNREYVYEGQHIMAKVPPSCCVMETKEIPESTLPDSYKAHLKQCLQGDAQYINPQGCYKAVEELMKKHNHIPIIVCCIIILFQLLAIAASIYLWRARETEKM